MSMSTDSHRGVMRIEKFYSTYFHCLYFDSDTDKFILCLFVTYQCSFTYYHIVCH